MRAAAACRTIIRIGVYFFGFVDEKFITYQLVKKYSVIWKQKLCTLFRSSNYCALF
jgi:hypothetical protein